MNNEQKEIIRELVYKFAIKVDINSSDDVINRLCSMNIDDAIDAILVALNDLLNRKLINEDDINANIDLILRLNPQKYTSMEDLIKRLHWIKEMNIEHPAMSLAENHKLIIEAFDNFNKLINGKFDCYYTGGIIGYIVTNHELERYHGDLDLFINEKQLVMLKDLVDSSIDFNFVSNMNHKDVNGHEYKIIYKNTPISIGLFLFERQLDNSITIKEYYFENHNINGQLFVCEHHLTKEYTELSFSNELREHNGVSFKMMSLESIYNSKKNSRPKDKYDAQIIEDKVDMMIDHKLDVCKKDNFDINNKKVNQTIIHIMEELMKEK